MTILLEFDLFYTIIKVSNTILDLSVLENEFLSWVYSTDNCRRDFNDGTYVYFFDDNTFIEWLKNIKLVKSEDIEIIVSHAVENYEDSIKVDGIMCF